MMPRARNGAVEIEYQTFGDGQPETVLLVNGLGSQMTRWPEAFCEKMVAKGYRVIRFDNRDTGLSTWFKDYVYIPLGGNRVSLARWCVSIGIVFLVSGLWHGANYTFLAWGALFGFYMIFGRITKGIREKFVDLVGLNRIPRIHTAFQIITVFLLTGFAWIFFRAKDFDTAMHIIGRMDNGWKPWSHLHEIIPCIKGMGVTLSDFIWCISLIVVLEVVSWMEAGERMRHFMADRPLIMRWAFLIVIIMLILNFSATKQIPFIYFQF